MNRGRKDVKPFILKAGFALLLSLAGIFAARHRRRRRHRRRISPPPPPPPLLLHLSDLETSAGELPMHKNEKDLAKINPCPLHLSDLETELSSSAAEELPMHQNEEDLAKITARPLHLSDLETELGSSAAEELPMHQNEEDLAKINPRPLHLSDLETELSSSAAEELPMHQNEEALAKISSRAPVTVEENTFSPSEIFCEEEEFNNSLAMAEEIKNLRSSVHFLQEREICLEMKLLEFHGLKEQEVLIRELQNRLKISATETKLLFLKIESLKTENEKLRAEVSDHCRVVSEIESQKKKIAVLESKLASFGEQAKEKIAVLHGRINELREKEKKDLENKQKLFNEVERHRSPDSVLKSQNFGTLEEQNQLREENEPDSVLKSQDFGTLEEQNQLREENEPNSVLKSQDFGTLEEQNQLREENENLKKKLEQIHSDHCEDVEELVYLRWINACLRYELRNYQPIPGRTVARDLSRSLSPNSEQKAKQLILDYSNPHLNSNRSISIDFDLDDCSSQTSSEEFDVASLDSLKTKSTNSSKSKLFNKLKKLVLGKGRSEEKTVTTTASDLNSERKVSNSTCGVNDYRRRSFGSASGFSIERSDNSAGMEFNGSERMMSERCNSDLGVFRGHKRMPSLDENSTYRRFVEDEKGDDPENEKLKKFAQVFRDSQGSLRSKRLV